MNGSEMPLLLELVITFFLVAGAIVALIGSIGLARLKDVYMRLHGPTKASTLGVGCILVASLLYFSFLKGGLSVQEALVTLFLFVTAPVSAHMMAKAALHRKLKCSPQTRSGPPDQ
ncbi:Na+/H+ antiporter subunit G [Marinobacter sp. SS13-12]|uniref:Na+/H+ antiporter subunit G n=1 Tax=Marinobacter sp. SS13-12 TaxID=3050451 RepID=UPI002553172D|nr:Na+/H+ antiporter subunit G [Marinobacter sp. SS13-12]MDK8462598.1 Na+/H+ antiporter subunit G [Marinobacter sp. SS13-12]